MFLLIVFIFLMLLEDVTISSSGNVMDLKQGYDFAYWCQGLRHNWLSHRRLQRDDFIMQQTQNESRWSCKTSQTDLQEWIVLSAERKKTNFLESLLHETRTFMGTDLKNIPICTLKLSN